jgi:hypothetical protein
MTQATAADLKGAVAQRHLLAREILLEKAKAYSG